MKIYYEILCKKIYYELLCMKIYHEILYTIIGKYDNLMIALLVNFFLSLYTVTYFINVNNHTNMFK